MRKEYGKNKKIALYGNAKDIATAEAIIDRLEGLDFEIVGYRLLNEGEIRLRIQDAIDTYKIKATIHVDGNTVYPYKKIVQQYERLRKSGNLEKMTDELYRFFHLNFDIAHYDKNGYIAYYGDDFETMKKAVLDRATTPGWYSDVRRILNHIQGLAALSVA